MFSLFAKIIKGIAQFPRVIIVIFAILAILCVYPIENLRWEIQLQDTLKGSDTQEDFEDIEKAFGGLGSLTIVLQSDDSLANFRIAESFAKDFEKDSLIHFIDWTADFDFFKKNRLLYADEKDLTKVIDHIDSVKEATVLKNNPLFVELTVEENNRDTVTLIQEIEDSYFRNLQQSFSNANGTIRVIDIYPTHSISDLNANRALFNKSKAYLEKQSRDYANKGNGKEIRILYTGKVFDSIQTGRMLLPEAKQAGRFAALALLILLILHFYKQPQLIVISAIPIALPVLFTMALAYFLYGRISLFTLALGLLLPGQACQIITHVLTRYFHEREKKLGPALSSESAILGIGPTVAASALIMAGLYISLVLIPLPALREFGVLGAIGSLMNLGICPTICTALLQFLQRHKAFNVAVPIRFVQHEFKPLPNRINWAIIIVLSTASLAGFIYSGLNLSFLYDFKKTEIQHDKQEVLDLIHETGFSTYDPIIVMMPDSSYNDNIMEDFRHLQERQSIPDLGRIYTQYQFLPKESQTKRDLIKRIHQHVDDGILGSLSPADSAAVMEMLDNYENDIKDFELSENIRRKFSHKNGNSGVFAFIIPNAAPHNGLTCRRIDKQIKQFEGIEDKKFKVCGTPILRATVLDMILANVDKSIILGSIILWALLLLYYNKLTRAFFTMLPSIFAMSWVTMLTHFFGIKISAYSAIAFVLLIGASVDGSLQLWASYYEKQGGNALTVLKTKFSSVLFAQLASLIGGLTLAFSSHPGIKSIGQIVLIGMICIFVSQLTIYPLIAGSLDEYRLRKKARLQNEKSIH
ncbi:MAG: MMPL family transporter [Fibrobacter sp.]|nr:MMPL family transporter [Fibrobacter sp.]